MAILDPYPAPGNQLQTLTQFEKMFARFQWSGVDGTPGSAGMQASLDTANRAVKVNTGASTTHAIRWECDAPVSVPIPAASAQDRIDRLVLRLDRTKSTAAEYVQLVVLTGTPGAGTPPSVTRTDDGIFDDYICRWTSAASGALSGLVDERSWMATDGIVPCYSYRRPSAGFGALMGELDTGKFRVGLGTGGFITFAEDTDYQVLTLDTTHFSQSSVPLAAARVNGLVFITGNVTCKISGGDPFGIAWLPDFAVPRKTTQCAAFGEGAEVVMVTAYASGDRKGQLWVTGNIGWAANGRSLAMNTSYPALAGT